MDEPRRKPDTVNNLKLFDIPSAPTVPELSLIEGGYPTAPREPPKSAFAVRDSYEEFSTTPLGTLGAPENNGRARVFEQPPSSSTRFRPEPFSVGPSFPPQPSYQYPAVSVPRVSPPSPVRLPGRIKKPVSSSSSYPSNVATARKVAFESDIIGSKTKFDLIGVSDKENEDPQPVASSATPSRDDESSFLRQIVAEQSKQLVALQELVREMLSSRGEQGGSRCQSCRVVNAVNECSQHPCMIVAMGKQSKATQTSLSEAESESKTILLGDHRSVGCGTTEAPQREQGRELTVLEQPKPRGSPEEQFYDNIMARVNDLLQKSGVVPKLNPHQEFPAVEASGDGASARKKNRKKKHTRRDHVSHGPHPRCAQKEDSVLEATVRKLREYGASFIDVDELKKGAAAAVHGHAQKAIGGFLPQSGLPHMALPPLDGYAHARRESKKQKKSSRKTKAPVPNFAWQGVMEQPGIDATTGRMKYMSILVNDDAGSGKRASKEKSSIEISAVDMQYAHKKRRPVGMPDFPGFGYPPMPGYNPYSCNGQRNAWLHTRRASPPSSSSSSENESHSGSSGSSTESDDEESEEDPRAHTRDLERRYNALKDGSDRVLDVEELRAQPKLL